MIKTLTSMRFFAALLIIIHHYVWLNKDFSGWVFESFWVNIVEHGYIGVSFFYTLSGFVLAYAYQRKFLSSSIKISSFYLARIARIYPLHLFTIILAIPLMLSSPWSEAFYPALFSQITLTQSLIPYIDYYFSFNLPSWSISNELFFYALFPFLIRLKTDTLIRITFGIAMLIIISWAAGRFVFDIQEYWLWIFYINPSYRLVEFALGILTFRASEKYSFLILNQAIWAITILEITAITALIVIINYIEIIPEFLIRGAFFAPIFSALIFVFSFEIGFISKLISNRFFVYLGEISFAMYMFHHIVIRYLSESNYSSILHEHKTLGLSLFVLLIVALSSISYYLYEMPLNKWIKRKSFIRKTNKS